MKKCNKCSSKYIGESGQTLKQRDIGHKSDINTKKTRSGLFKHIQENPGHEIDWENQIILDREPNMFKRRIKEAMFIRANDDGSLMNLDKGTMINNCWTEFNGMIRKFYEVMISTFPRIPEISVEGNSCIFISYFRVSVLF